MLPFILFAFVASITPGPTNILVLSNSARFGWRAVVPLILGACTGAALLVLLVGMGSATHCSRSPMLSASWHGSACCG